MLKHYLNFKGENRLVWTGLVLGVFCYLQFKRVFPALKAELFTVGLTVALSLCTNLMLIKVKGKKQSVFFKTFTLLMLFKNTMFMTAYGSLWLKIPLEGPLISIYIDILLLELIGCILCYLSYFGVLEEVWNNPMLCVVYLFLSIGPGSIIEEFSSQVALVALNSLLIIASTANIYFVFQAYKRDKRVCPLSLILVLIFILFEHLCVAVEMIYQEKTIFLGLLRCFEIYCLLIAIYLECWKNPWEMKLKQLHRAEHQIEDNAKIRFEILNLSHELKTPVNVIRSAIELLKLDYKQEPEKLRKLNDLSFHSNVVLRIIKAMLDLYQINNHSYPAVFGNYNAVDIVEDVIDIIKWGYKISNIEFKVQKEEITCKLESELMQRSLLYLLAFMIESRFADNKLYLELVENKTLERVYLFIETESKESIQKVIFNKFGYDESQEIRQVLAFRYMDAVLMINGGGYKLKFYDNTSSLYLDIGKLSRVPQEDIKWSDEEKLVMLEEDIRGNGTM